jgi:spore coat protein CotH
MLIGFLALSNASVCIGQNFFNTDTIQEIRITFDQPNWDYRLDTAKLGQQGYMVARRVTVNNVVFDSVGVKYKGNSSYDSTNRKNPLHIALSKFKNQDYQGIEDIKLSNVLSDPTFVREVMSYEILRNYMPCPLHTSSLK